MPLTRDFRETVQQRAYRDPEFRAGLYQGAVQTMLEGDFAAGRILLRDFINARSALRPLPAVSAFQINRSCACSAPPAIPTRQICWPSCAPWAMIIS